MLDPAPGFSHIINIMKKDINNKREVKMDKVKNDDPEMKMRYMFITERNGYEEILDIWDVTFECPSVCLCLCPSVMPSCFILKP